ncbi:MAG TPA: riboflavin synthase [Chthonomonadaceae bacterium]|nr:riboflavin synthase [Chthonomonadaceae bacterium]
MFTGLVEATGRVLDVERETRSARIRVCAPAVESLLAIGASVAVNGCCLTVVELSAANHVVSFDAIPETMDRTNLGDLEPGDAVNLERPLAANARLDGHFVQGHIDGVGIIRTITPAENAVILEIEAPESLARYFVEKGSVAVDGVSLTVASVDGSRFTVWTIPHTRSVTTLGCRKVRDRVNLECDLIGKYIERLLSARFGGSLPAGGELAPAR